MVRRPNIATPRAGSDSGQNPLVAAERPRQDLCGEKPTLILRVLGEIHHEARKEREGRQRIWMRRAMPR
jgi:hypothetical protein